MLTMSFTGKVVRLQWQCVHFTILCDKLIADDQWFFTNET